MLYYKIVFVMLLSHILALIEKEKKANLTLCRNSAFAGKYYGEEVWQRECKQKRPDPRNASGKSSFSLFMGKGLQTIKLVRKRLTVLMFWTTSWDFKSWHREKNHTFLVVLQKIVSYIGSTLWTDSERQRLACSVLRKPLIDESLSLVPAFQIHSQAAL